MHLFCAKTILASSHSSCAEGWKLSRLSRFWCLTNGGKYWMSTVATAAVCCCCICCGCCGCYDCYYAIGYSGLWRSEPSDRRSRRPPRWHANGDGWIFRSPYALHKIPDYPPIRSGILMDWPAEWHRPGVVERDWVREVERPDEAAIYPDFWSQADLAGLVLISPVSAKPCGNLEPIL